MSTPLPLDAIARSVLNDTSATMQSRRDVEDPPLSRQEAREFIEKIRTRRGNISEKIRCALQETAEGRLALEAIDGLRPGYQASTRTLATELYTEGTRFVYELIQNAEDNSYDLIPNGTPFLHFTLYKDKILVESNEDGFRAKDVVAICSTGESSKKGNASSIGEKGIGFKSIFSVAKKVHIQSEPFSFSLHYERGAESDALGMITPIDEKFEVLPQGVTTRMTLTLHESITTEAQCRDLFDMPCSLLLFLRKLKTIKISFRTSSSIENSTIYSARQGTSDRRKRIIDIERQAGGSTERLEERFLLFGKQVEGLAQHERRPGVSSSQVTIAFPITAQDQPASSEPYVFAFLPLRRVGFKFLIHGDFLTAASRQDVIHCRRNSQLLEGVAKCFVKAVKIFGNDSTLAHSWLEYLPKQNIHDEFWRGLMPRIMTYLEESPILHSRGGSKLYKPCDLRLLSEKYLLKAEPLFDESKLSHELYLSQGYSSEHRDLMFRLGVKELSRQEFLMLAKLDVGNTQHLSAPSDSSKIHDASSSNEWHAQTARALMPPRTISGNYDLTGLQDIALVPLQDETWSSIMMSPIYFPKTGTSLIPKDLELRLVDIGALSCAARKDLFLAMGVKACPPETVIKRIYKVHTQAPRLPGHAATHLRYLFEQLPMNATDVHTKIHLLGQFKEMVWLSGSKREHMYFDDRDSEYNAGSIFYNTARSYLAKEGVHFLLPGLLLQQPTITIHGRSFRQWLEEVMGVRTVPALVHHTRSCLSTEFRWILTHQPGTLIHLLKAHWTVYEPLVQKDVGIKLELRLGQVPIEQGTLKSLHTTYMPFPRLKKITLEAGVASVSIPYLKTDTPLNDQERTDWSFLKTFVVGIDDDLNFYLALLEAQRARGKTFDLNCVQKVYQGLAKLIPLLTDEERKKIRSIEGVWICYPSFAKSNDVVWSHPSEIHPGPYWRGPSWLADVSVPQLAELYPGTESLFCLALDIHDFRWEDAIDVLKLCKTQKSIKIDTILSIYSWLAKDWTHHTSWDVLRKQFEQNQLVFVPHERTWSSLTACVWAKSTLNIPGKSSIALASYSLLEDFFVRILGIPRPDLSMYVKTMTTLAKSAAQNPQWREIKATMGLISSMFPTPKDLEPLRKALIFPVRTRQGTVLPTTSEIEFAIIDRPHYAGLFPEIKTLNFTLTEVHAFTPFLISMGLERKFMSALIQEKTNVGDGILERQLTEKLRQRAYALFRCAYYYHSAKTREDDMSMFSELQLAEVYTSDDISSSLTLVQDGLPNIAQKQKSKLHIENGPTGLCLYVPADRKGREFCYLRQLPRHLRTFLGITDTSADGIIGSIVNSTALDIVDDILRDQGVVEVAGVARPSELDSVSNDSSLPPSNTVTPTPEPESLASDRIQARDGLLTPHRIGTRTAQTGSPSQYTQRASSPTPSITTEIESASASNALGATRRPANASPAPFVFGSTHSSVPFRPSVTPTRESSIVNEDAYGALLGYLVRAARRFGESLFPAEGSQLHLCPLFDFTEKENLTAFPQRTREQDVKIGAAGELFVYELLRMLNLPGFDLSCWKSTISQQVNSHPDYKELTRSPGGPEEADIVYEDSRTSNGFLGLLDRRGYQTFPPLHNESGEAPLASASGSGSKDSAPDRTLCRIEVKTTLGDCSEPFFVSDRQYDLMTRSHSAALRSQEVYIIMRVFHLEREDIGLRVFVDPIAARTRGELRFEKSPWKVFTTN